MNRSGRSAVVAVSLMLAILASASCSRHTPAAPSYLFLWAGDAEGKASDFLGVIDAAPGSPRYGSIVASIPTGTAGTHPHHTELEMPANGHLLANGFRAGRTWLFDLTQPSSGDRSDRQDLAAWFLGHAGAARHRVLEMSTADASQEGRDTIVG